jgi:hypothetical protein
VKGRLKRLRQEGETCESDFRPPDMGTGIP